MNTRRKNTQSNRGTSLWRCPKCGREFAHAGQWHSCGLFKEADYLKGRKPAVLAIYRALANALTACAPVAVSPTKTMVCFKLHSTAVSIRLTGRGLEGELLLGNRVDSPRFERIVMEFTLINTFLLKPVAGREPNRLVGIYSRDSTRPSDFRAFSYPNFTDLRAGKDVFEDVFAMQPNQVGVTEGEFTRRVFAMNVSANYFAVFGVNLPRGRAFLPEEETHMMPFVIVSHRWWTQHGSDPEIVGRSLKVNGRLSTIVGVAPAGFTGTVPTFSPDLFLPLSFSIPGAEDATNSLLDRTKHAFGLVGRLELVMELRIVN